MTEVNKPETTEAKPAEATATKAVTVDNHAHPHHNLFESAKDVGRYLGRSAEHILPYLGEIAKLALTLGIRLSPQAAAVATGISVIAEAHAAKPADEPTPIAAPPQEPTTKP